jgi:hypothetical protein
VGVAQAEAAGTRVHERDEATGRATDARREGGGGVVGAGDEHGPHEVGDGQALACPQARHRLDRQRSVGHRADDVGQLLAVEDDQSRHQLRRGGDRAPGIGPAREDDVARRRLDEDCGGRSEGGRCGGRGGAGRGRGGRRHGTDRGEHQRPGAHVRPARPSGPPACRARAHGASFSRRPVCSV